MGRVNDTIGVMSKKKLITPEELNNLVLVGNPNISPNGKHIAYTRKTLNENQNKTSIWCVSTDGKAPPIQLTTGDKDSNPQWSPCGSKIAFTRSSNEGAQIFTISMTGGEAQQLTTLKEGSIGAMKWSPSGESLAISYRETNYEFTNEAREERKKNNASDPPLIADDIWYRLDGDGYFGSARFQLHLVDASTGNTNNIWSKDKNGTFDFCWHPKGSKLAITTNTSKNASVTSKPTKVVIYDIETKKHSTLPNCPNGPKGAIKWSPDGKWLAWAGREGDDSAYSTNNLELFVASATKGEAHSIAEKTDKCLLAITLSDTAEASFGAWVDWTSDSKNVLVKLGWHGEEHLYSLPRIGGRLRQLTKGHAVNSISNSSTAKDMWAMTTGDAITVPEIAVGIVKKSSFKVNKITSENTAWCETRAISEPKEKWIKSKDKTLVHCWIMKPPKEATKRKKHSAILQIHGGPHAQYGWAFFHEFQCLASAGYTVIYSNPRGSKGYGQSHCEAIRNDWGGADWVDMQAVIKMMNRMPSINSKKMGVMGGSYGGYMTNWIVGNTNEFKAAITDRCVSNLVSMGGNSDYVDEEDGYFGGNFWSNPEDRWRQSPIRHFGNVETPMLIIHSEGDLRCNIEQSEQVFSALQLRGIESRFVRYPRSTSHGLSRSGPPDLRKHRLYEILTWWKRHF